MYLAICLFCPYIQEILWLFGQKCLFGYKCLNFQSIERFGSPLMAESFQACFYMFFIKILKIVSEFDKNF